MKCRVTKKEVREDYSRILRVGYCEMQFLLSCHVPFGYSTRVEGWACDYYEIVGEYRVCISTGYSPIGKNVDHKRLREAEKRAMEAYNDSTITYEDRKEAIEAILKEWIKGEV